MEARHLPPLARLYLWATHRLYNEFAWAYDLVAWAVSLGRWDGWRRLALDYVVLQPVLEVGFGTGELLMAMARLGWDVTGLDLSPAMQGVTARKMRRRHLWAPRIRGRVQDLPLPDGWAGTIISTFPAQFILDHAALRELARVLQPAGRVVVAAAWVEIDSAAFGAASRLIFGAPTGTYLERIHQVSAAAGLQVTLVYRDDPPVRVPILLLEKPS